MPRQQESAITAKALSRACEQSIRTHIYQNSIAFAEEFFHFFFSN